MTVYVSMVTPVAVVTEGAVMGRGIEYTHTHTTSELTVRWRAGPGAESPGA